MVSVYVQNKDHIDADLPLSKPITRSVAQDSKAEVGSPTDDTEHDVSLPSREPEQPVKTIDQTQSNVNKADTPDVARAREALPSIPNDRVFEIEHDDGTAAELMARADDDAAFADKAELATDSAITCFLRFGDLCKLRSEQLDQGGDHRNLCQH